MLWQKLQNLIGYYPPVLALTLVEHEVRYVVRHGVRILAQGTCSVPTAIVDGRLIAPEILANALLPKIPKLRGKSPFYYHHDNFICMR